MVNIKLWLRAVRPFAYPASVIPVILGMMLAAADGYFSLLLGILTLLGGLLLHTGTNLINDYYDYKNGVDTENSYGSSGILVASLMKPKQILIGGCVSLGLVVPIAIYLFTVRGYVLLALGVIGLLGGYFYTASPIAYKYRGLGVPMVFLLMGPLMVGGAYFVQTGTFTPLVLLASLPVGCLVGAILHANEYRDVEHDRCYGITNPTIRMGRKNSRFIYYVLVITAYLLVTVMAFGGAISKWSLLTWLTLPIALKPMLIIEDTAQGKESPQLPLIDVFTSQLHLSFGLLMIFGVTLGTIF